MAANDFNLNYTAPRVAAQFIKDTARFKAIKGPIGSGKSVACVMNILKNCMEIPPFEDGIRRSRWVVVRNTLSQLQDTTIKTFFEWVKPGVLGKWHESKKVFNLKFGDVEAEILFRPLDSPDDVQRVLSLEITGAWVNECRSVPVSLISDLQGRCGRYPRKADVPEYWSGVIADTNPPDEDTDWWRVFEQLPLEEGNEFSVLRGGIYHQPPGMSPDADNVENLIDGYYENLSQGRPHAWVDVYVNGNYGTSQQGLPIYRQSFRRDKHVIAGIEPDLTLPVVIGMDFGRTPAALYMQLNRSGRLQAFKESVSFGIGMDTFIAEHVRPTLLNHFPGCPVVVIGDPSGVKQNDTDNNTCFKVLKAAGFDAKPAKTNAPDVRINTIENALLKYPHGDPYFQIHPDCKWFIQGLHTKYMYRKIRSKPGQVEDKPSKNDWSHIVEAGQYGVLFVESGHYNKYDFERQYESDPFNFTTQSSSVACSYAGY